MVNLVNLIKLRDNLQNAHREVTVTDYCYNGIQTKVIVHRLPMPYQKIWPIKLTFYNMKEHSHDFFCYANAVRMSFNQDELIAFFHMKRNHRIHHEFIDWFYENFDKSISTEVPDRYTGDNKDAMERYIYLNEPIDERNNIYINDIRPYRGIRPGLNNDKAAVRYPDIYKRFCEYKDVCFFFSPNKTDECTLDQLVQSVQSV